MLVERLNLELKEEYKKGAFGKVSVAGGTEERWAGRGRYDAVTAASISAATILAFACHGQEA